MAVSFVNFKLPEDIERGVIGGPQFQTTIFPLDSGLEQRNTDWVAPRGQWDAGYGLLKKFEAGGSVDLDLEALVNIFYVMEGMSSSFMFKDWSDFEIGYENSLSITAQTIALGDDATTVFQLFKQYVISIIGGGTKTYIRPLTKISDDAQFQILLDGVLQTGGGTDYTMDFLRAKVTFVVAPASTGGTGPSDEEVVSTRCNFFNHVRFGTDKLDLNMDLFDVGRWPSFPLQELRENGLDLVL